MQPKKTNTSFIYLTALILLLAVAVVLFLRSSLFTIREVKVAGLSNISLAEVERLTAGIKGQNIIMFDQDDFRKKALLNPLVQSVSFQRILPATVVVEYKERSPVALVVVPRGIIEVDQDGVFLRRHETWPKTSSPVITGINVPDTAGPGQKLNISGLTAGLKLLSQAPPQLLPILGEVNVNPIEQMTLFLNNGVEVRLGKTDNWNAKLLALLQLINDASYKSIQKSVRYIDFTAAKPVIGR